MHFFKDLSIRSKLLIAYLPLAVLATVISSAIVFAVTFRIMEHNIELELSRSTDTILNMVKTVTTSSIRNHLRALAEKNREIVQFHYKLSQSGALSEQEAKAQAAAILLSQQIGKTGYIYCINSRGIIQVHPRAKLHNVDLSKNYFIKIQKIKKEGYIEYNWANPGETIKKPKALYMSYFKPWDWIISVSSYREEFTDLFNVEDFENSILSMKFGDTGYSYILDEKGNIVIHPVLMKGDNFYNTKDATGRLFFKEMIENKRGKIIYFWQNPGEKEPREKLAIFNYIPELGWSVISSSYREEFYNHLEHIGYVVLGVTAIMIFMILFLTWWISSTITRPLKDLMLNFEKGAGGDFTSRMNRASRDELGQLSHYYNNFMGRLQEYSENLEELVQQRTEELHKTLSQLKEKTRELFHKNCEIETDLHTAEGLQRELFSHYSPPSYLKIATRYIPYSHVSGDIYKLYQNDQHMFNLFLGDSTGHGVAAALTTIMADILLVQQRNATPMEAIKSINESLEKNLPPERFMTAVHAQISPEGLLTLVSAGHPPIIIIPASGGEPILLSSSESMLLGIFTDPIFQVNQAEYQLKKGDKGILYSDGIIECTTPEGSMFGLDNLCRFIRENHSKGVKEVISLLLKHVETFTSNQKPTDDITLVGFEYLG